MKSRGVTESSTTFSFNFKQISVQHRRRQESLRFVLEVNWVEYVPVVGVILFQIDSYKLSGEAVLQSKTTSKLPLHVDTGPSVQSSDDDHNAPVLALAARGTGSVRFISMSKPQFRRQTQLVDCVIRCGIAVREVSGDVDEGISYSVTSVCGSRSTSHEHGSCEHGVPEASSMPTME